MKILIALLIIPTIIIAGCEKFGESENETKISRFDSRESHETGNNCMSCHYSEGKGEGWFTLAGTLNGSFQNAQVELYKSKDSISILNIEVDKFGNFYTTKAIDYTNGLYVAVRSSSEILVFKEEKIFTGQCNLCHGYSEDNIKVIW